MQKDRGRVVKELNLTTLSHLAGEFILLEEANPEWLRTMPLARVETKHYIVNIFSPIKMFMAQQFNEQIRQMFEKRVEAYEEPSSTWSPLIYFYKVENDHPVRCEYNECFFQDLLPPFPQGPAVSTILEMNK